MKQNSRIGLAPHIFDITLVTLMTKIDPFVNNCKPRGVDFMKEKIEELSGSLEEQLEPTPRQRKMSYHQALHMLNQFTYIVKDCNYRIEPEN